MKLRQWRMYFIAVILYGKLGKERGILLNVTKIKVYNW